MNVDLEALGVRGQESIEFNLGPNPTADWITINGFQEQITGYSIIDVTGRSIMESSQNSATGISIDVSNLTVGSYLISIQTPTGVGAKRFVKR